MDTTETTKSESAYVAMRDANLALEPANTSARAATIKMGSL